MMFTIGDEGVVSSVDEENLIYVDKNELEQFIESYQELEKENEQLKSKFEDCEFAHRTEMAHHRVIEKDLKKENEQLKKELRNLRRLANEIYMEKTE